jgi:hypothetical protein
VEVKAFDIDFRFTPESGHLQCTSSCLLWADSVEKVGGCDARISVIQSL